MDGQHLIPISAVNQKLSSGNSIDPFIVRTIHGKEVSIPDRDGRWTHLQFRRFAGCLSAISTFRHSFGIIVM